MSLHLYLVSPTRSTLEVASPVHPEVRAAVELRAEAYAYVAQITEARRDFITLRETCLEQIATTKALIEAMDACIRRHHQRLPGWNPNEGTF